MDYSESFMYELIQHPELGARIKEGRKAQKLTQRQLGQKLGVSYQTVAYWESGQRTPTSVNLAHLAVVLGKPDDFFFCRVPEERPVNVLSTLYDNLRRYRKVRNLSQTRLAEIAEIPLSTLEDYEDSSSGQFITKEHLECLCSALGVERDDLLGCPHTVEDLLETNRKYNMGRILAAMENLNSTGFDKAAERIEELTEIRRYCE